MRMRALRNLMIAGCLLTICWLAVGCRSTPRTPQSFRQPTFVPPRTEPAVKPRSLDRPQVVSERKGDPKGEPGTAPKPAAK
mgnify:CR=1 FL=1